MNNEHKILADNIKANQAQYNLEKEVAKFSALSSKDLDKYEYLTGEDSGYKPGVVEQAEFKYPPLSKVFNKGLEKEDLDWTLEKILKTSMKRS